MKYRSLRPEIWLREADAGRISIEGQITGDDSQMILDYLLHMIRSGAADQLEHLTLFINCYGTDNICWPIACCILKLSQKLHTIAYIDSAKSGGLIIALAATARRCSPRAEFMFYGSTAKEGHDESGMNDEDRVAWMVARTAEDYDPLERGRVKAFWAQKAESGDRFSFGPEEALQLGIVKGIASDNIFDFHIKTPIPLC